MDIRDAYFSALHARCAIDPSVIVIVGDFDAHWLNRIAKDFPAQYFNAGIAEQNMVSVAAGLALEGRKPFVCGQNNFITLRAMEQISVDVCQMRLPVTLVGVGSGFAFSIDGPTHHGVTDLGMMLQLPIDIYNVSSGFTAHSCVQEAGAFPAYHRLGKGEGVQSGDSGEGWRIVKEGSPHVVTSGVMMLKECLKATEGTGWGVIDHYRPSKRFEAVGYVVEDNLRGPIAKLLGLPGICPADYVFEYGPEDFLLKKAGLDAESIRRRLL